MSTSQKILDTLTKSGPLKVSELAVTLDLTPADIRYQLKQLIGSGQVQSQQPGFQSSRGRPSARYEALSQLSPKTTVVLVELMVDLLLNEYPKLTFSELAEIMWNQTRKYISLSPVPLIRVTQIIDFLQSIGVQAVWEAGKSGPKIIIIHNPYVVKTNPRPYQLIADSLIHMALQDATGD